MRSSASSLLPVVLSHRMDSGVQEALFDLNHAEVEELLDLSMVAA
jgi:hypothetical protein